MKHKPTSYDYQKQNIDLTKAQFDIVNKGPNQSEPFVGAVDDFLMNNKKRRGVLQAGIEGIASGLKYGSKRHEVDRKQQLFDWLESNIMAMRQKSDYLEKQQMEKEALEPIAAGAIRLAYSDADYDTVNNNARSMWDQAKMKGLVKGNFISLVPKTTVANYQNDDGSYSAIDLATYAPEAAKEAADMRYKNLSLGIQQQRADDYGRGVDSSIELNEAQINQMPDMMAVRKKEAATAERNSQTRLDALGIKSVKDIVPKMEAAWDTKRKAKKVLDDIKKHPDVFSNVYYHHIDTSGKASSANLLYQKTLNPEKRNAYLRIKKNLSALMVSNVQSIGGKNNMTIDKWIMEGNPNMDYSPEVAADLITDVYEKADFQERLYRGELNSPSSERVGKAYDAAAYPQPQQSQNNGGMVSVQDPSTGEIGQLSPEEAQIAISRGGIKVS